MRERIAADHGFATQLPGTVIAGCPRAPPRLIDRGSLGDHLEGRVTLLFLLGRRILQRLCPIADTVEIDGSTVTPERALVHHQRDEHAVGAERRLLRSAD